MRDSPSTAQHFPPRAAAKHFSEASGAAAVTRGASALIASQPPPADPFPVLLAARSLAASCHSYECQEAHSCMGSFGSGSQVSTNRARMTSSADFEIVVFPKME